jgi:UDP-N-acetylmuramoylalanine--D-glutamate ligase
MNEFQGKTAAVIGLARAGAPAAKFLASKGAHVLGFDGKTREQLAPEALELEKLGVQLVLGDHNFAGIEKCDLVVLSPGLKVHFEPLQSVIAAAEARRSEVIGELELASRFCPCPIIGVTGTKGKSTTTKLITEMLRACDVDAIAAGNTGTPLIEVLPQLKAESWAVVEVSSFQLEKAPTFRPKIAVLLSLLEDHQDYHPTLEQYWETKLKIFANQREAIWGVFNDDDKACSQVCKRSMMTSHWLHFRVLLQHRIMSWKCR